MIPTSNNNNLGCNPISSNCVIWQGPDINCGNLVICNGDSVSDVVAKLADELCDATHSVALNIDVKCLEGIADPTNLDEVVQALIDKVCETTPPVPGSGPDSTLYDLPTCLVENGVVKATVSDYIQLVANKVCSNLIKITQLENALTALTNRVIILEDCVLPCSTNVAEVNVLSSCILKDQEIPVSQLLLALETNYCEFRDAVGTIAQINNAVSAQCIFGNNDLLSGNGTFGAVNGWQSSSGLDSMNLARTIQNQWIVLCDLYDAVLSIQDNCCTTGCDATTFGFVESVTTDSNTGLPSTLNLNFTSSNIPSGFEDCGGFTTVRLTDSNGQSTNRSINVTSLQNNPNGSNIDLSTSGLNLTSPIAIQVEFCVTDGTTQCAENQTKTLQLSIPCPTSVNILTQGTSSINVAFNNPLTNVDITIDCKDALTNAVVASQNIPSAGGSVSELFTGLNPGTNYIFTATITDGSGSVTCDLGNSTTLGTSCSATETVTLSELTVPANSIYLGKETQGEATSGFWYNVSQNKIYKNSIVPNSCEYSSPEFSNYSITGAGVITIDLGSPFGGVAGTSDIFYEYSLDNGLTYQGTAQVAIANSNPVTVNIATGATDGTIYLRVWTNCPAFSKSVYSIIRYDFITDDWILIHQPTKNDNVGARFDQIVVGQKLHGVSTLDTDGQQYSVPNGSNGRWFYLGKVYEGTVAKHLWAAWSSTAGAGCTKVVLACDCPAFVSPTEGFLKESGYTVFGTQQTIKIPYIIGGGTPYFTIIQQPQYGNVTNNPLGSNTFIYTNTGATYADSFQVQVGSEVSGDCQSSSVYTVQIQVIGSPGLTGQISRPIYMYTDTTSFTTAEAQEVKNLRDKIKLDLLEETPDWKGEVYLIPVQDSRYVSYAKSAVDDGASASLDADPAWTAVRNLPPSWSGGTNNKEGVSILSFSNAAAGQYHSTTLAQGWGSFPNTQPTIEYLQDYEEYLDIQNGTEVSAWAQTQGFGGTPPFPNELTVLHYPITTDTTGSTASSILQGLGAYVAEMINPDRYGIKTAVDVSGYLMQGLVPSATNPYEGAVTPGGVTIEGLWKNNFTSYLDQPTNGTPLGTYLQEIVDEDKGGFSGKFGTSIEGTTGGTVAPSTGPKYEVTSCGGCTGIIIQDISGGAALNVGDSHTFYIQGSPLTGVIVATSVAAADYVASEVGPVLSPSGPPCDLVAELAYLQVTNCTGFFGVFYLEINRHTLCPGDVVKLTNNSGADIPSESGAVPFVNGTTQCFTVGSLVAPEQVKGAVTYVQDYVDCPTCLGA